VVAGAGAGLCGRCTRGEAVSGAAAVCVGRAAAAGGVTFATLVGCFFGTATGWSAARVTVPLRVKFWSALGPIASAAGVLVELLLCDGTSWASAVSGLSASAPASNAIPKRETALICSRYAR